MTTTNPPTPAEQDLARRAVRCKHFRWMAGMLTDLGERINAGQARDGDFLGVMPDLNDEATCSLLRELVRHAWGLPVRVWPSPACDGGHYVAETAFLYRPKDCLGVGPTPAAALVSALEAAP